MKCWNKKEEKFRKKCSQKRVEEERLIGKFLYQNQDIYFQENQLFEKGISDNKLLFIS